MILGTCFIAALAAAALTVGQDARDSALLALAALFGACALPIYSLCVAHANDRASPESFVEVSSRLLLVFGLGAIFGPILAGQVITRMGASGLFAYTAVIHASLALFVFARLRVTEAVPREERSTFGPVPPVSHATQVIFEMHPTAEIEEKAKEGQRPTD